MPEPDVRRAISVGAEQDEAETDDINAAAEELLRSLPGVGTKNYRYVMGKVNSIKELCEMKLDEMQELLGVEPGKKCFDFLHHGMRKS
jgi:DNA excision repair protein ERCC-4